MTWFAVYEQAAGGAGRKASLSAEAIATIQRDILGVAAPAPAA